MVNIQPTNPKHIFKKANTICLSLFLAFLGSSDVRRTKVADMVFSIRLKGYRAAYTRKIEISPPILNGAIVKRKVNCKISEIKSKIFYTKIYTSGL